MGKTWGHVFCLDDGRFEWCIDDFLSAIWHPGPLSSPLFTFADESWYIVLTITIHDNRIYICLRNKYDLSHCQVHVKLGMKTGYRGKLETRTGTTELGKFEIQRWMQFSEMLQRRCEIVHDGRLTVYCELKSLDTEGKESDLQGAIVSPTIAPEKNEDNESDSDSEESVLQAKSVKKVIEGLKNLLTKAEDCDATVKIQGKEFPVHRGILRVRSPVFESMFMHKMAEKETGVVVIEDCDPLTFPDFLNHVYTGSTKHVCAENVFSLYTASDKYCMEELKEACVRFIENNISVDIFCDVITLALRHNENRLIKLATDFFCKTSEEIIKTPKWHTFLSENTIAGNELFAKALSYSKNI